MEESADVSQAPRTRVAGRRVLAGVTAGLVVLLAVIAGVVWMQMSGPSITASSSASGSDAARLVDAPIPAQGSPRETVWTSGPGEDVVWLRMDWTGDQEVNRVRIASGGDRTAGFATGALEFGDGSAIALASDSGDVSVSFPPRTVRSVTLVITATQGGAEAVELAAWSTDARGDVVATTTEGLDVTASASTGDAAALLDASGDRSELGDQWLADPQESAPWVELSWGALREVASVQIDGPEEQFEDPAYAAAAPLNGVLVFDDGSRVEVSGIAGGGDTPTTIGFMPRVAQAVRLELDRTINSAEVGLREFHVYPRGVTPPSLPVDGGEGYSVVPADDECGGSEARAGEGLALLCPSAGAVVAGDATVEVSAPPGAELSLSAWVPDGAGSGSVEAVAGATADLGGVARMELPTASLAHGPVGVRIDSPDVAGPLHVQFSNTGGVRTPAVEPGRAGRTLILEDDFTAPLSVSQWGSGARYAATKPAYWGGSEFGDAIFADPEWGGDNLATVGGDYLRIRVDPARDREDPYGWGRSSVGGLLSSLHVGGAGGAVQYGYFEARMLAPGGTGTWPAFWMQNTSSVTKDSAAFGEIDAVELYGHNTARSCHSTVDWIDGIADTGGVECLSSTGVDDWTLAWHTFAVDVRPDGIDYYIDGQRVTSHEPVVRQDEPFFYMINLALGGGWPVDLSATDGVADLYVDWIRVYA